jgi:hypothetical protein
MILAAMLCSLIASGSTEAVIVSVGLLTAVSLIVGYLVFKSG